MINPNKDEKSMEVLTWLKENHPSRNKNADLEQKLDATNSAIGWDENSIHAIDKFGNTSLHAACTRDAPVIIVQTLLECLDEETINAKDLNDQTSLHYACWSQASGSVIELLLEKLSVECINTRDKDRENALHYAFAYDLSVEIICLIIRNAPDQASVQNLNRILPCELYNKEITDHKSHIKKLSRVHQNMEKNGQQYYPGLFKHLLRLPNADMADFMNLSYLRRALNREIIKPFTMFALFLDGIAQLVIIYLFSFHLKVDDTAISLPITIILAFCFLELLSLPMIQLTSGPLYVVLRDPSRLIDIFQLFVIGAVLFIYNTGSVEDYNGGVLLITSIGISWFRLIFVAGNLFYSLATFVAAFVAITYNLIPFAFVVAVITSSFAHMYHALGPPDNITCHDDGEYSSEGGWMCSLPDSYFRSFAMTLGGEWEFFDQWEGLLSVVSLIFALLMGIILLNMLIALISDIFTRTKSESELVFWVHRLRLVDQFESIRGATFCVNPGTGENVKMEKDLPPRISFNNWWNENREGWKNQGEKYRQVLNWFCNISNVNTSSRAGAENLTTPNFFLRISVFSEMSTWGDIIFLSKAFRKFVVGVDYTEPLSGTPNVVAWIVAALVLVAFGLKFVITLPLGLVTGGYFWEREIKEFLFFGKEDVTQSAFEESVTSLKAQVKYQKCQLDDIKAQNESIMQVLVALQATVNGNNSDTPTPTTAQKYRRKQLSSESLTELSC